MTVRHCVHRMPGESGSGLYERGFSLVVDEAAAIDKHAWRNGSSAHGLDHFSAHSPGLANGSSA